MKMKKYEVSDMKEALRMIKEDLGPDAVILSTRKVMKSNNFGLFARPVLEVTAAIDYDGMYGSGSRQTAALRQQQTVNMGGAYPSAYSVAPKQKIVKPPMPKPKQVPQRQQPAREYTNYTQPGYGNRNYSNNSYFTEEDSYLADAMAEAGIIDDDISYYEPKTREPVHKEPPVTPAYTPKPQNKRKTSYDTVYEEENIQQVSIEQNVENKSQAELNAEKMAAIIKAVGLDKFADLLTDIGDIKKQLANMQSNISDNIIIDLPANLKEYHNLFLKNGVDDIISYRLLKNIEDRIAGKGMTPAQIKSIALEFLSEILSIEDDYASVLTNNKIMALAGPTGVGKTTTIAKIAATMALKYGKKVCLITVDNFRIGAVEQLKTYAEIVNLPLYVATSPEELYRVLADVKTRYDSILIDSMGRGQFDAGQISGIGDFFKVDENIAVSLVLSMAANHNELYDTFDRYEILKPNYLIFTKLDETRYFGPLINLPVKKKLPLLLVTTGQNVPDDMEIPSGKKIAKRVLQEIPTQWSDK